MDEHKQAIKDALDYLLDIAEEFYPQHSSDSEIGKIDDLYKVLFDNQ